MGGSGYFPPLLKRPFSEPLLWNTGGIAEPEIVISAVREKMYSLKG
jgi:hypothetical protein